MKFGGLIYTFICFMIMSGVCIQKFYPLHCENTITCFLSCSRKILHSDFVKFLCIGTIKLKFKTSKFINFDLSTAVACFLFLEQIK